VLLPDNVFFGPPGALVQLLPVFERRRAHVTGLIEVTAGEAPAFGNCGDVRLERIGDGEYRVLELGDKGPGFLSMAGGERRVRWYARHILLPSFFDYLERFGVEKGGEVDDVPVFKAMVEEEFVVGKVLRGKGFDAGNERGLLAAQCYRWKMESESWS
jgi:UTP-glucose-1-phosphate uridylyltransferase